MEEYPAQQERTEEQLRDEQGEKLVHFLERTHAFSQAHNLLENQENKIDFKEFEDFLARVNGIARDIPIHERGFDGSGVEIKSFVETVNTPRQEDKEMLLKHAFEAASRIPKEDLKYMLPAIVNAVHLFMDGNGRTSRVLHLLLRDYPSETECLAEIRKSLGEFGRHESFNVNPGEIGLEIESDVSKKHGWTFNDNGEPEYLGPIKSGIASIEFSEINKDASSPKVAKNFFRLYGNDVFYALTAIHMVVGDDGVARLSQEYGGITRISPIKMVETFSEEDWNRLLDAFYSLKKEHVEELVDIFVHPESHKTTDKNKTLRDYFIEEVEKNESD